MAELAGLRRRTVPERLLYLADLLQGAPADPSVALSVSLALEVLAGELKEARVVVPVDESEDVW